MRQEKGREEKSTTHSNWASGENYVGQYKDGKRNGKGTFTDANGGKYVGQYKDEKRHGLGKFTYANGQVHHDGEWVNGEPKK